MRILPLIFAVLLLAAPASAITLDLDGSTCGSCAGADISLEIVDLGGSFDVTLTWNADNYSGPADGLVQVGFGGIHGWTSVTLDDSPASSVIGWSNPVNSNISSSSLCSGSSRTDKVCSTGYVDITGGGTYVWDFTVTGGTVATDTTGLHIGGQYADLSDLSSQRGPRGKLISEAGSTSQVPEPSAALLFGVGLLVAARGTRR